MNTPPSRLRVPVAVLLGVLVLPLGLVAWIALSGSERPAYMRSKWVRGGAGLVIASTLPLLLVAGAVQVGLWPDPNPNPIGLGLLLLAGGGLGTLMVALGIVDVSQRGR